MKNLVGRLVKEEEGQAITEYGLLVGLIALGVVTAMVTLGDEIAGLFGKISDQLKGIGIEEGGAGGGGDN